MPAASSRLQLWQPGASRVRWQTHYPTYNGIVMAFSLKPNGEGNGWDGSAVYYPRDSVFGYADFRVAAHRL